MDSFLDYQAIKVKEVTGRYLPYRKVVEFFSGHNRGFEKLRLGVSVKGQPVHGIRMGSGPNRVLLWSQMHGNETTTTRALLDLVRWLQEGGAGGGHLLEGLQLFLIPVLNPDGADAYTRHNANQVDLNRDARNQSEPESKILSQVYADFDPGYCFNLHDQRTIYGVGETPVPATLSFLAPAANDMRDFTPGRRTAARLISRIAYNLGAGIGIGRYDDTFNPNCVGDSFQAYGTPTVLFEAGHFPGDYQRETTRYHLFRALKYALSAIRDNSLEEGSVASYLSIPENRECFVDVVVSNAHALGLGHPKGSRLGIHYDEVLQEKRVCFLPRLVSSPQLAGRWGHLHFDAANPSDLSDLKGDEALYARLQAN